MSVFETDTRVEKIADNRFKVLVDPGWNISANPNGGYLVSLVTRAMVAHVSHPDPISITTHYLRPGVANTEGEVQIDVIRTGRTISTVRGTLMQEGKQRLEVIAAFGDLSKRVGLQKTLTLPAPEMPAPEACVRRSGDLQGIELPITGKIEARLHPLQVIPGQATQAEVSGWIRLADKSDPDSLALVLFCDSFPPSPFPLIGLVGWVPTIELTVHVRRRPAPGWVLGQFKTDDLHDGRMIETGKLWDSEGELVAQSRQIGLVLENE